jgi:hypothetical protein
MKFNPARVFTVLDYMQRGGKLYMDGRTWVWLDNHVVRETDTETWVIDGLAIEGRSYKVNEDWNDPTQGKPHFLGQRDLTLHTFIQMVEELPFDEYKHVCLKLDEMRKSN